MSHPRHLRSSLVSSLLAGLLAAVTVPGLAAAADWPSWRGPNRDGKSPETGLIDRWPEDGPPLLYRVEGLGTGYSSVAVVGDRAYTLGDLEDGQYAIAVDLDAGEIVWRTRIGPRWEHEYGGPRSTPTVDGDRLYVLGTDGDLAALRREDGKVVWRRNLQREFGGTMMSIHGADWRFSESPLVDGDRVLVTPGSREAAIVALAKSDGEVIFRTAIPELGEQGADGAGYSSIVVSEGGGVRQYVQLLGRGVIGVDARDGELLWNYNRVANNVANIATPIVHGDHVFVSTGYDTGSALLRLAAGEDGRVTAEEVYFLEPSTLQNHHGGMILDDGLLYTGTGHNKGFPICVELASGEVVWGPQRTAGRNSAAVTWADGHLYLRYQDGRMILAEATGEEYREKGTFMIPDVDQFSWSHPVVAHGKLFLREQNRLYAYDLRPREPASAETSEASAR